MGPEPQAAENPPSCEEKLDLCLTALHARDQEVFDLKTLHAEDQTLTTNLSNQKAAAYKLAEKSTPLISWKLVAVVTAAAAGTTCGFAPKYCLEAIGAAVGATGTAAIFEW